MPRLERGHDKQGRSAIDRLFSSLRDKRNGRISATDYLIMPDYPLSAKDREKVEKYRQSLRDLPSLSGAPWDGGGSDTPWPELVLDGHEVLS